MPKFIPLVAATVALVVVGAALGGSAKSTYTYKAPMTPAGEIPKPKAQAGAKGLFTATVTESASTRTLKWKLTYSGLSGKAVAAHVHKGKAGVAGGVLIPLCGPCVSGQTGQLTISTDASDLLERGRTYVNVHTAKNAGGEIRGQIKLVAHVGTSPTPSPVTDPATTTPDTGTGDAGKGSY